MSTNLYIQKNPFSQNIEKQTVSDGRISDIIRKIDARTASNTGWRVMLNDEIITDFGRVTRDGDSLYVKLIPEGDSPKDVAVAEKWSGAGLMAIGGLLTAFTGGIGVTVGGILISAGLSVFANGVIGYNTQPGSKKKRERAEQDPSIRGAHNQARPLENIPILLGKRRIYPDPAANPYTWVDKDGSQYLYQLFCCGQKDQVIDLSTVRIGETLLKDLSGTGDMAKITSGEDPLIQLSVAYGESQPPLMQKCVHEDQLNQQLVHQTEDKTPGDIIHTTPDNTDTINVDIFFPQGLGKYEDDNSLSSVSVVIKAFYKQASEPDSAYTVLGSFAVDDKISAKELKTKRYSVEKAGLAPDAYTVKIVRETADSKDNGTIDTCYVGSVRAIKSVSPVSAERCAQITLIGLKIKASEKLSNYIDQLNFVSQSKLPVCSGTSSGPSSWNGTALSSNPASAAMYAMRGDVVQQKLADTDIDWISFRELYQWCAEHGYECNAYITDSMPISELLANIGSTCRAEISRQNGKIRVIHDIVRSGFVQLFTPRNSSNYSESILFADIPDELVLSFPDEKSGYAENELKVYNTPDGNRRQIPDTSQDMPLWGVTSDVQARKLGMFNLSVSRARPVVHTFNADFEYMLCQKGDWIKYAGDIALAGIAQGRIVSLITDRGILIGAVTDEAITTEPGKTYGVRIRRSDGTCILEEIVTTGGTGNQFDFVRPIPADYAEPGNLFTFGEYDRDSIDLIVTDIRCGDDLTAEITAVGYAPEIFAVDEPDFVLPDYTNQLSEFASAVDAGTVESAMSASTSALNARISEIRASKSATSASASATTAGAKASEASTSATSASESATSAKTSESNAATSAANAQKVADFVRDFDANWDERVSNTKVNGHTLIEGGYINTDIIEADSITVDKLNVLVKNKINNFSESGNAEGWDLSNPGVFFDPADRAIVATRQTVSVPNFYSAPFSVNPHDILKFDFDLQTIGSVSPSPNEGLYLGLTYGNEFNVYKWSKTDKCWVLNQTSTNCYFVNDFRTLIPVHFTTYIIGKAVDINSVPAGSVSSELDFYCLQLIDRTITTLRTGYNSGPAGIAWKFSNPVITDVSGGTIIGANIMAGSIKAEQINVDSLVVKTAKSSNFSQKLDNKNGFFMDGEHNIEYHYGDAIYDSKYIKNSDLSPCVSFGPNSGFSNRFKGDWDNSKIYYANDVVLYYNKYYVALGYIEANLQTTPKTSPFWSDLQADAPNSIAIGGNALSSVTTGNFNTAIGANALRSLTTGRSNVAVGREALNGLETGGSNVAVGDLALNSCGKSTYHNVAIGDNALVYNKGSSNIAIGFAAGYSVEGVQPGSHNVFIGDGISDRGGNNRILIGCNIDTNFFTWSMDNYINLNDRILCFEFPKGTKKGYIYTILTMFLAPYTTTSNKKRGWISSIGFSGSDIIDYVGYKTATSILRFYDYDGSVIFEITGSSVTTLTSEDIVVCFVNNVKPVGV